MDFFGEITNKNISFLVKIFFSQQNELNTSKTAFLVFCSIFAEIYKKKSFLMSNICFSHLNEPNTAKLSFSGVLKHFCGN